MANKQNKRHNPSGGTPPQAAVYPDKKKREGGAPVANPEHVELAREWSEEHRQ